MTESDAAERQPTPKEIALAELGRAHPEHFHPDGSPRPHIITSKRPAAYWLALWKAEKEAALLEGGEGGGIAGMGAVTAASAETIAEAISLKVLADAPDSRGPFVLEIREFATPEIEEGFRRVWTRAFQMVGREAPPLIVLGQGMRLAALPSGEARAEGIARLLSAKEAAALRHGFDDGERMEALLRLGLIDDDRGPGRPNRYRITGLGEAVRAVLERERG